MYAAPPVTIDRLPAAEQHRLGSFFGAYFEGDGPLQPLLRFALVIAGEKPATVVQAEWNCANSPFSTEREFIRLFERLGCTTRRFSALHGWIVGHARGRFDLLPTTWNVAHNAGWHRRLGVLFGYPACDIRRFLDDREWIRPRARVESGTFTPAEVANTAFLCHRFEDSIDGYRRAIAWGRRLHTRYQQLAQSWELPILAAIADRQYEIAEAVYSGERAGFRGEVMTVDE